VPDEAIFTPVSARTLRALAHPLRIEMLQLLHAEGPATASSLARRLGESSGATSYHLRALARAGLIVEGEQRNGRERWWRRNEEHTLVPSSVDPAGEPHERAEKQAATAELLAIFIGRDQEALDRWQATRFDQPLDWQDASFVGNFKVWGTPDELRALTAAVRELADELRKTPDERSEGACEAHFTLRVLPLDPSSRFG
jgi:DNA-binding transcriptional ArsR family regulator